MIQFARRPPKFRGVHFTSVKAADAPILRAEIAVLLAKDAIEPVPPADMRTGFYSPFFTSPEVGMAMWHSPGPSHTGLPPNLHPVVRHFISPCRSAHETGLQACCGSHGCLHHRLGGHVQRACSVGGLDGPPTALAHQLPRVAGSTPGLEPSQDLRDKHVLVCTDNTATVAYIN